MEYSTKVQVKEKMKKFIPQFLNNTNADIAKLKAGVAASDFEALHKVAHSMKGYGKPFGFDALGDFASKIQIDADAHNIDNVAALVTELEDYMKKVNIEYL